MDFNFKELPVAPEAEQAVCGAVICAADKFGAVDYLSSADFYDKRNAFIFSLLSDYAASPKPDYITLKQLGEKRGVESAFDSVVEFTTYIFSLIDLVPSTDEGSIKHYADIVKEKSKRRGMISKLSSAIGELYNPTKEISKIEQDVCASVFKTDETDSETSFSQAFERFVQGIKERRQRGDKLPGLSTGFDELDRLTGGLESGKLYVIGGRPSMGKTALGINIAANIALSGKRVAFFSLEMSKDEIIKRIMSGMTGIAAGRIKRANVSDPELEDMRSAAKRLNENFIIDDKSIQTAQGIMNKLYYHNAKNKGSEIDAVVIDYLGLLSNDNKRLDRRLAIGESSRMCKMIARELKCPVILLSQLSRANESRNDKMPILSDLRESGDIEQDADVVAFVHRPEYYKRTAENQGLAQINIAKNRDGEVGVIELRWNGKNTTFSNLGGELEL